MGDLEILTSSAGSAKPMIWGGGPATGRALRLRTSLAFLLVTYLGRKKKSTHSLVMKLMFNKQSSG